jgi:LPS O-antigen subunit length determinant protein (WzzB/FepE family)
MSNIQTASGEDNINDREIDILKTIITIWKSKIILLSSVLFSLFISIIYLHNAEYLYTAEIKIFPVQSNDSGGGFGKQLSGLASLAGVGLGGGKQGSSFDLYTEEIFSREIAESLSQNDQLMRTIYKNEWDSNQSRWKKPNSLLSPIIPAVKVILGLPIQEWQIPNAARLQKYINENIKIDEKTKKSTISIIYNYKDPIFAVHFLNTLYKVTDDKLRQRALDRSTKYINYLNNKLQSTTVSEYRSALVNILSDQEKLSMIASSNVPYSAESLGSAVASLKPMKPIPLLVLFTGVFIGFVAGILIILGRNYFKSGNING